MKRIIFSLSLLLFMPGMYGQTGHITLEECQQKTQDNYPLVRQYDLVEKTKEYNLENAARGYLPQFALSAKASYQSDVTELPIVRGSIQNVAWTKCRTKYVKPLVHR